MYGSNEPCTQKQKRKTKGFNQTRCCDVVKEMMLPTFMRKVPGRQLCVVVGYIEAECSKWNWVFVKHEHNGFWEKW